MATLAPTIRASEKTPVDEGDDKSTCSFVVSEFDGEKHHLDSKPTKIDSDFEDESSDDEFVPDPRDVERFRAEMASHGGFGEITYFRGMLRIFFISPIDNPMKRAFFLSSTKAAIDQYNKDNKESQLVLEKILNFNFEFACLPTAYLTFQAIDGADNKLKTYHAVLDAHDYKFLSINEKCQSSSLIRFRVHLGVTPHNLTESDFEMLARKTKGFSGSDIAVCVKDVLFEPVRKTQDAMFFIKTSENIWMPCGPKQPGAVHITMQDLAAKGLASKILPPPITRTDFDKVLARQRPTVSKADLGVHERFTKEFGEEG